MSALLRRGLTPTAGALAMTIGGFGAILVIVLGSLAALAGPMEQIVANASSGAGKIDELARDRRASWRSSPPPAPSSSGSR